MIKTDRTFGYKISQYEKQQCEDNMAIMDRQYELLKALFNTGQKTLQGVDAKGFPIVNINRYNSWFAKNVIFVFGKGAIYDEEDDRVFEKVLSLWANDIHGRAFLINNYLVEDYRDSVLLQTLEKQLFIVNGNYHICMIPLVLVDADISEAPELELRKHGIVDKFMNWESIEKFIDKCVANYGLMTDYANSPNEKLQPLVQDGFNINSKIDVEKMNEQIEYNLKRSEIDSIHRGHVNHGSRDGTMNNQTVRAGRRQKHENLYLRVKHDDEIPKSTVNTKIGVASKGSIERDSNFESIKNPNFIEFKLRDDDASYDYNTRKNKVTAGAFSQSMPNFNTRKFKSSMEPII